MSKTLSKQRMGIEWRLNVVMADRQIKGKDLAEKLGIHRNTMSNLRKRTVKYIDTDVLNTLCQVLECEPSDLIRYTPDKN